MHWYKIFLNSPLTCRWIEIPRWRPATLEFLVLFTIYNYFLFNVTDYANPEIYLVPIFSSHTLAINFPARWYVIIDGIEGRAHKRMSIRYCSKRKDFTNQQWGECSDNFRTNLMAGTNVILLIDGCYWPHDQMKMLFQPKVLTFRSAYHYNIVISAVITHRWCHPLLMLPPLLLSVGWSRWWNTYIFIQLFIHKLLLNKITASMP